MSEKVDVNLPKLGESLVEATVVKWLKRVGDSVLMDEALVEVSTDKVNSEIPAPVSGVLAEILVTEGVTVEVGALLARIQVGGAQTPPAAAELKEPVMSQATPAEQTPKNAFLSSAVVQLAQANNLSMDELHAIKGTGAGGRVSKKDVEAYLLARKKPAKACPAQPSVGRANGGEERVKMSHLRKAIADNMVRSFYEAPHASLITEVDMTDVLKTIEAEKERFLATHHCKLSLTSFIVKAIAEAVSHYPMVNASLEEDTIVIKNYVNVGIAVSIENGVIVPVLKNCQERNLVSIAKGIADFAARAREGKLSHHEISEGSITLTNFGMTGTLIGIPIIRYPEVAIIGVGAVVKRVVPMSESSFAVRSMMHLSLTFDHRVLDGIYGCNFLNSVKQHLEHVQATL